MPKSLVIGFATNISFRDLLRFAKSARGALPPEDIDIVLYCNSESTEVQNIAASYQITLLPVDSFWGGASATFAQKLLFKILILQLSCFNKLSMRRQNNASRITESLQEMFTTAYLHPFASRWLHYEKFLRVNSHYIKVMFTDVRDVVFQMNPFLQIDSSKLYLFETPFVAYGQENLDSEWIRKVYGIIGLSELVGKPPLCAGTVLGGTGEALSFLRELNCEIRRRTTIPLDQAIMNHVVYTSKMIRYESCANSKCIVFTNSSPLCKDFEIVDGEVCVQGVPVAVVHQFDRTPDLLSLFNCKFGESS